VVDVRPIFGEVLYKSRHFRPVTRMHGKEIVRDWDYLQYFIDEARRLGLRITASATIFPAGHAPTGEGLIFDEKGWDDKTCVEYKPDGTMMNIRDDKTKVATFLSPVHKKVRKSALRMVREIVKNYDIDGFALDYCRFPDGESDFSPASRKAFERYIPADIFTYNADGSRNPGKYYKEWWAFRAKTITSFVKDVQKAVHSANDKVELVYWAASWINALFQTGQNWASPKSEAASADSDWGSAAYNTEGFAPYIDNFMLGAYMTKIHGLNDAESIEFAIARANKLLKNDCKLTGTIFAPNHKNNIGEAIKLCLAQTGGLMVFDIVQVIEFNLWDDIRCGIAAAEAEMQ